MTDLHDVYKLRQIIGDKAFKVYLDAFASLTVKYLLDGDTESAIKFALNYKQIKKIMEVKDDRTINK